MHTPGGELLKDGFWKVDVDVDQEDDCLSRVPLRHRHEACSKIRRSSMAGLAKTVGPVSVPRKQSVVIPARAVLSDATASIKKMAKRIVNRKTMSAIFNGLPDPLQGNDVVLANQRLVDTVIDILYLSTYTGEANVQAAKFLLDLNRADHIQLTPETYALSIAYLCSYAENPAILRRGVFNLHRFVVASDNQLNRTFWSRNYLVIKYISAALASTSHDTVHECTEALIQIITTLDQLRIGKVQIFLPSQFLRNVFQAFQLRLENYPMAHALENLVLVLDKIGKETSIIPKGRQGSIDMTCTATTQSPSLVAAVRSVVLGNEVVRKDTTRRIALVRSNSIVVEGSNFVPSRVLNEIRNRRNLTDKLLRTSISLIRGEPVDAVRREGWTTLVRESLQHRKYGSYFKTFLMEAFSDEQMSLVLEMTVT